MKIVDLKTRTVAIPLNAQLRHNTGVHPGYFLRTVLELVTDEGLIGLDTPISEFDFDFPQSETATLAQLLGMTSGIFSYTEDETFAAEYIAKRRAQAPSEDSASFVNAARGPVGEALFAEGYGMVELGGAVATKISPPMLDLGLGDSLGVPLPGYRFKVVDDDFEMIETLYGVGYRFKEA